MRITFKSSIFIIVVLATLGSQSCENPKSELINFYDEFYNHVLNHEVDSIYHLLSPRSKQLVSQLTDEKNMNLDSIVSIGEQYRLHSFTMDYFLHCMSIGSTNPTRETFFTYLSSSDCKLFSFSREYIVDKDRLKLGDECFISVVREEKGTRRIGWVRIENLKEKSEAIDIIYTLNLCSKDIDLIYNNYRKNNDIKTRIELYKLLLNSVEKSTPLSESDINELISVRKARYEDLKENNSK